MSIFEVLMMMCFGVAWPFSIYRSHKSRSNRGKSLLFLLVVLAGYVFGIIHKLFYNYDKAVLLYVLNFVMVLMDTYLYFRNVLISK
jgi:hypothetical protein